MRTTAQAFLQPIGHKPYCADRKQSGKRFHYLKATNRLSDAMNSNPDAKKATALCEGNRDWRRGVIRSTFGNRLIADICGVNGYAAKNMTSLLQYSCEDKQPAPMKMFGSHVNTSSHSSADSISFYLILNMCYFVRDEVNIRSHTEHNHVENKTKIPAVSPSIPVKPQNCKVLQAGQAVKQIFIRLEAVRSVGTI